MPRHFLTYVQIYDGLVAKQWGKHLRNALSDTAELHCLLASGYAVSSHKGDGQLRSLAHKTSAIELIARRLLRNPRADVSRPVYQLLALELFVGDYEAAFQHLKALRLIISDRKAGSLDNMLPHLWTSDVSLAYQMDRPTVISIDTWDTPLTATKFANQYLDSAYCTDGPVQEMLKGCIVDPLLLKVITDIPKAIELQQLAFYISDQQSQLELIQWLHIHFAALAGRLINLLCDQIVLSNDPRSKIGSLTFSKALHAAISLAMMCYLHQHFTRAHYGGGQLSKRTLLEPLLQHAIQEARVRGTKINDELLLWLLFMSAVNSTLLSATWHSRWSVGAFTTLRLSMGHGQWDDSRQVLRKFLYSPGMEELLVSQSPGWRNISHPQQEVVEFIDSKTWGRRWS